MDMDSDLNPPAIWIWILKEDINTKLGHGTCGGF